MTEKKSILLRLDKDEFDRVTALANATVFSREEFIRQALRGTTIQTRPPAEYGEIIRELRRIGSNVHQLLLKSQTLGFVDELMLREIREDLRHMDRVFLDFFAWGKSEVISEWNRYIFYNFSASCAEVESQPKWKEKQNAKKQKEKSVDRGTCAKREFL